jgi:hypothetical protein
VGVRKQKRKLLQISSDTQLVVTATVAAVGIILNVFIAIIVITFQRGVPHSEDPETEH